MKTNISIIAAIGENRELGKNNKLLWHIPEDFARFKKITSGHPVIMGRKTFESIGKALPERTNIIITRDENYKVENCLVAHSLDEAIESAKSSFAKATEDREIFIIGGGQIYNEAIDIADKLYLTIVKGKFEADTFFPDHSRFQKKIYSEERQDDKFRYTFLELV